MKQHHIFTHHENFVGIMVPICYFYLSRQTKVECQLLLEKYKQIKFSNLQLRIYRVPHFCCFNLLSVASYNDPHSRKFWVYDLHLLRRFQSQRNSMPMVIRNAKSRGDRMQGFSLLSFVKCFNGCRDHTQVSGLGTRIWNLSDKSIELQIRVGSILKKAHTLKPGASKRLKCKSIYRAYMPGRHKGGGNGGVGMRSLLYYYDETCHPYIWIHDTGCDFSRMVKQQYISLEDLRDCSEIRIFRDHQRGCIAVRKKARADFC